MIKYSMCVPIDVNIQGWESWVEGRGGLWRGVSCRVLSVTLCVGQGWWGGFYRGVCGCELSGTDGEIGF